MAPESVARRPDAFTGTRITAAVFQSKIDRDDHIYSLRNVGVPRHHLSETYWSFGHRAAMDYDGLIAHCRRFRDRVLERAADRPDFAKDRGITFISMDETWQRSKDHNTPFYFAEDLHLDTTGHRDIAEQVLAALER